MVIPVFHCQIQTEIYVEELLDFEHNPMNCNVNHLIPVMADVEREFYRLKNDNTFINQINELFDKDLISGFVIKSNRKLSEGAQIAVVFHCLNKISGFDFEALKYLMNNPSDEQWHYFREGMDDIYTFSEPFFVQNYLDPPFLFVN